MRFTGTLGILCAVGLHAFFILFGGLFFDTEKKSHGTLQEVELLGPDDPTTNKEEEKPPEKTEVESDDEPPPDAAAIIRSLESPAIDDAPALEAASLSAIEAALNGRSAAGDFAQAMNFLSGGRIGGLGKAGGKDGEFGDAFDLSEIDQKPRPVFQGSPIYPAELRGKKIEGVVTLTFVVDMAGKVVNPQVEKSTHSAFDNPALNAIKKWRFEPAVRGGQRVSCKVRQTIRFPVSP